MSSKEIFAVLEIADHEIRLVVAELHQSKLNVMKVEKVETSGIHQFKIVDESAIIHAIQKAVSNASRLIGASIKKVILVMPSYNMNRYNKRFTIPTETGKVEYNDVNKAIRQAYNMEIDETSEIVNLMITRYHINGYATRRLPLHEKATTLSIEAEIFCADKEMVYQYIKVTEKAGLDIIDICLDSYAIGCEAALYNQTSNQYIVSMRLERETTTLSLLANGILNSCMTLNRGYGEIIGEVSHHFGLPLDISARLLLYNMRLNQEIISSSPIYYWTTDDVAHTLSEAELTEKAKPLLDEWVQKVKEACAQIFETNQARCVITGEGAQMQGLAAYLKDQFNVECSVYVPETLGVRNSALSACMGAFYAYIDSKVWKQHIETSVDEKEFIQTVTVQKEKKDNVSEDTLSNRFKKIFGKN